MLAVSRRATSASDVADETEQLWCTPSQLLSEVESRIAAVRGGAGSTAAARRLGGEGQAAALPIGGPGLTGPALLDALQQLRAQIKASWLDSMAPKQE